MKMPSTQPGRTTYRFVSISILAVAVLAVRGGAPQLPATIYVAANGSDGWSGQLPKPNAKHSDGPLATLEHAVEATRAQAVGAKRIVIRGGRYFLNAPIDLKPADSGLTIEGAAGEKVLLAGGHKITGWQRDGDKFWSAPLPDVAAGKWDFRMLIVDGVFCTRARLPETGTFTHVTEFKVPWMSTTGGGWKRKPTPDELTTMKYRPSDLGPWLDIRNAELTIYHMWDESLVGIASLDDATQTVRFNTPSGHPPGAFGVQKYVVWNVREGMHQPGQWYLDRSAGKVVYWPRPRQDMTKADVLAPTVESIFRLQGTTTAPISNVTLRRLTLSVTGTPLKSGGFGASAFAGAVTATCANNCSLKNLTIENIGGQAIKASKCSGLRVENCETHDTGAGGIRVEGTRNVVANNLVHHVGLTYPSAIGVSVSGEASLITHNEIHDTPYSAVTASGNNHRIEQNLIHAAMKELHDGAGIYITFCTNIVVRGNVVRDISDTGGYGASAYYLDEQARYCLVESNLALRVNWPMHCHMTTNNVARANVFIADGNAKISLPLSVGVTLERNIICATGDILVRCATNGIAAMPNNILFSRQGTLIWENLSNYGSPKGKSPFELCDGSVCTDPMFVNPARGDFRFKSSSPAPGLGIHPLDWRNAGRRNKHLE